jgi:hypothetical protein
MTASIQLTKLRRSLRDYGVTQYANGFDFNLDQIASVHKYRWGASSADTTGGTCDDHITGFEFTEG